MKTLIVRVYPVNEYDLPAGLAVKVKEPTFFQFIDSIESALNNDYMAINVYADETQFATIQGPFMAEKITQITGFQTEYYPGSRVLHLTVGE